MPVYTNVKTVCEASKKLVQGPFKDWLLRMKTSAKIITKHGDLCM